MKNTYQSRTRKSTGKFEVVGGRELAIHLPLPPAEVWEHLQGSEINIWLREVFHRLGRFASSTAPIS